MLVQNSTVSGWSAEKRATRLLEGLPVAVDSLSDTELDEVYDDLVELLQEAYDTGYVDCEDRYDR